MAGTPNGSVDSQGSEEGKPESVASLKVNTSFGAVFVVTTPFRAALAQVSVPAEVTNVAGSLATITMLSPGASTPASV